VEHVDDDVQVGIGEQKGNAGHPILELGGQFGQRRGNGGTATLRAVASLTRGTA
jgi:hypothetical protein